MTNVTNLTIRSCKAVKDNLPSEAVRFLLNWWFHFRQGERIKFDVFRYKKAANCCQVKAVSSFVQSYTVAQFDGWTLAVCHHTRVSRDHILWQAVSTALPQLNPKMSWLHWAAVARGEEMNLKKHLMIIWINNVSNGMLWHHYPKALRELMQHIFVLTQHPIWSLQLGTSGCMCGVT